MRRSHTQEQPKPKQIVVSFSARTKRFQCAQRRPRVRAPNDSQFERTQGGQCYCTKRPFSAPVTWVALGTWVTGPSQPHFTALGKRSPRGFPTHVYNGDATVRRFCAQHGAQVVSARARVRRTGGCFLSSLNQLVPTGDRQYRRPSSHDRKLRRWRARLWV